MLNAPAARIAELPRRNIRQRGKPAARGAQAADERARLLRGEAAAGVPAGTQPPPDEFVLSLGSARQSVERRPLPNARGAAAAAIQFELLLGITKPIVPLVCLVATGQVFNGLLFSMIIAQTLGRVPAMRHETIHLLVFLCGALPTLRRAA